MYFLPETKYSQEELIVNDTLSSNSHSRYSHSLENLRKKLKTFSSSTGGLEENPCGFFSRGVACNNLTGASRRPMDTVAM